MQQYPSLRKYCFIFFLCLLRLLLYLAYSVGKVPLGGYPRRYMDLTGGDLQRLVPPAWFNCTRIDACLL